MCLADTESGNPSPMDVALRPSCLSGQLCVLWTQEYVSCIHGGALFAFQTKNAAKMEPFLVSFIQSRQLRTL